MTFLNGALLPGLVFLTAAPLLIHLLNLQFPRLFEFSSIKHIRETVAQRSRMFRWRHLVLLALRTAFLIALLLAFLKPILPRFGAAASTTEGRRVLLLIDHSLSMEHRGGGVSSRQRAEAEAEKIFATLDPHDSVNVVRVGAAPTTAFVDFSRSHSEARRFVHETRPGFTRADFTQANAAAARLLTRTGQRGEIYYLSDFQRKNWANVDFTALPPGTRIFFVDVAPASRGNRAILSAMMSQTQILAGDTVQIEVEVGNFRDEPLVEPLKVVIDARTSFEKEISVAPWSVARITLPVPPGSPGLHLCELSLAPDDLPEDDRHFISVPVLDKEGILIVADAAEAQQDSVRYLATALNPYEKQAGSLLPERIRVGELNSARLASVKKVFFTRAGLLTAEQAKLIADFTFQGGGVVYFLDGENDGANLELLNRATDSALPLRLGKKRIAQNVGTSAQQISRGDFKSRFLRLFRGPARQNLSVLEFYDIHDATSTGTGQVILSYSDDTPAVATLSHGLGTLVFMNFSVGEFSSNLARQRIFPAWMQEIVKNLASEEPVAVASTVGETVHGEVWKRDLVAAPLRSPSGVVLEPKTEAMGERLAISFTPDEPGFYSMRTHTLLHAWGVNVSPEESDLRPIDRQLLPDQLGEQNQKGHFVGGQEEFAELARGRPLFHWFVLAAAALLLCELAFQLYVRRAAS